MAGRATQFGLGEEQTVTILQSIRDAAVILPRKYDNGPAYQRMLLAIAYQESDGRYRRQLGNGPARGLWQCEKGTPKSRGGVCGVMLHDAIKADCRLLCDCFGVPFDADAIWSALEFNDVFAAGIARLLLWTGAGAVPTDRDKAWAYYESLWRPGRPRPLDWPSSWSRANNSMEAA